MYTDGETASWEDKVAWWSRKELTPEIMRLGLQAQMPLDGRILADLTFYFERPKSTPKKVLYPMKSRTDVDNLAKAILDAIQNAGVIHNDNGVTDLFARKRFATPEHPPGVDISLTVFTG